MQAGFASRGFDPVAGASVALGRRLAQESLSATELADPAGRNGVWVRCGGRAAKALGDVIEMGLEVEDPPGFDLAPEDFLQELRYAGSGDQQGARQAAHPAAVLDGRLEANGQFFGPGAYAHSPGGEPMRHQATEDGPWLFVPLFHGPFDVHLR